jgi:hypothetical protein
VQASVALRVEAAALTLSAVTLRWVSRAGTAETPDARVRARATVRVRREKDMAG